MQDKNGTKLTRGTRVMLRFEDHGPEHAPFEWTGKVVGKGVGDRIRVKSEFVDWRPAGHFESKNITKLVDQAGPVIYREHRENGRVHVAKLELNADDFAYFARLGSYFPGGRNGVEYI